MSSRLDPVGWKELPLWLLAEHDISTREDGITVIPYHRRDSTIYTNRYVHPSGRRWWDKGTKLIPFGLGQIPRHGGKCLYLVEGESDTLALRLMLNRDRGHHVIGCPGSSVWQPEWAHVIFPAWNEIIAIGDGDTAGRSFMKTVQKTWPSAKAVYLRDGEDVRHVIQQHGPDDIWHSIETARLMARIMSSEPSV